MNAVGYRAPRNQLHPRLCQSWSEDSRRLNHEGHSTFIKHSMTHTCEQFVTIRNPGHVPLPLPEQSWSTHHLRQHQTRIGQLLATLETVVVLCLATCPLQASCQPRMLSHGVRWWMASGCDQQPHRLVKGYLKTLRTMCKPDNTPEAVRQTLLPDFGFQMACKLHNATGGLGVRGPRSFRKRRSPV